MESILDEAIIAMARHNAKYYRLTIDEGISIVYSNSAIMTRVCLIAIMAIYIKSILNDACRK
jgi:hypothetical protein